KQADVVVEDFSPGVMSGIGLGYADLELIKPDLIMTSITYFGQTGPYREFKGHDMIGLALGGLMYITGLPDREPLKAGGSQAGLQAGINAAVATLTALYCRDLTGIGQHVDVSVVECIASIMESATLMYSYNGWTKHRTGARHSWAYPSTILPCKDGYVHVHGSNDWEIISSFMDEPRLLDPKLREGPARSGDDFDALAMPWLKQRTKQEIFESAQLWRLPFAMVCAVDEICDDPQFKARDFFVEVDHPEAGPLAYPGAPFRMTETPWRCGRAPLLGEHNTEVFGTRLGLTHEDLVRLKELGVI
ncbi:MAG: CoA transferase, partial [Dehalococcoidia bacterium]|nr:CoA transferase [Dehalococcoidia bacterium]